MVNQRTDSPTSAADQSRRRVQVPSNHKRGCLGRYLASTSPNHVASALCSSLNFGAFFCASFSQPRSADSALLFSSQPSSFLHSSLRLLLQLFSLFSSTSFVIGARGAHETLVGGDCMSAFSSHPLVLACDYGPPSKASSRVLSLTRNSARLRRGGEEQRSRVGDTSFASPFTGAVRTLVFRFPPSLFAPVLLVVVCKPQKRIRVPQPSNVSFCGTPYSHLLLAL